MVGSTRAVRSCFILAIALLLPAGIAAQEECANFAGVWDVQVVANGQVTPATLTLEQEECALEGHADGQAGRIVINDGKAENQEISFRIEFAGNGQSMTLFFEGELEEDEITGTVATPEGALTWSGKKRDGGL